MYNRVMLKKIIISFFLISLVQLSFFKVIDKAGSQQLDKAFTRSITVFAIARSLNGLVSVLQGTEIYATPAGVGMNFAVGQIVDPMNDMIERFSWIMLMSSVSLGIQEILLDFGQTSIIQNLLALCVLVLLFILWVPKLWHKKSFKVIFQGFVIVSFLRFFVPLIVLLNENVYTYALEEQYEKAKMSLEVTQTQTETIVHQVRQNQKLSNQSWLDSLNLSQQVENFKLKMENLWKSLKNKFDHAVTYMLSLIAIFLVQSVLLPLGFLWFCIKIFRRFMQIDITGFIEKS